MTEKQIQESFEKTGKALAALKVMLDKPMDKDRGNMDASIHRFEFSVELFWKLLKRILAFKGQEVLYPKDVLREAYAGKLIDHDSVWLTMLEDRNLTSHTYNQELADAIYKRLPGYYDEMQATFDALCTKFAKDLGLGIVFINETA